jgi:multidrug efflux pump subunit AcrA (membrane-fusion protein)
LAGLLALVVVGLVASFWKTSEAATPAVERASMWTERVKRGDLLRQVPVQGSLVPEHVQWLSAVTAARVARIAVRPGAQVEPETVVLTLENTDLELAALEAERQAASAESRLIELDVHSTADEQLQAASLASLRADLRDADRHAETANRLAPAGLMGENERTDTIARAVGLAERFGTERVRAEALASGRVRQIAAQQAEITRMREIATFRRRQLDALEVRAGIRGVVQDIPLENGQWVAIGTVLAKVAEPGRLKAEVKVAESYARDVVKGMTVRFEGSGPAGSGHVSRVDPAVVGGSVRLEVQLDQVPPGARADQGVSGYVEIEKLQNVLYVARPAGVVDSRSAGLFRLDPGRTHATRVNVQLGRGSARDVEVVSGLEAGDEIVVSDVTAWEASSRVRLK